MALKKKESLAVAEALYHEFNKLYFNAELPDHPMITFRKWSSEQKSKYYPGKQTIALSSDFILVDGEDNRERMQSIANALKDEMLHYYEEIIGEKPGKYKRYYHRREIIEGFKLDLKNTLKPLRSDDELAVEE